MSSKCRLPQILPLSVLGEKDASNWMLVDTPCSMGEQPAAGEWRRREGGAEAKEATQQAQQGRKKIPTRGGGRTGKGARLRAVLTSRTKDYLIVLTKHQEIELRKRCRTTRDREEIEAECSK
eukprot:750093-Hanusia_phi.AAC.2